MMFKKIFSSSKNKDLLNLNLFELLKILNHFTHQNDKIYTNEANEKFILTKYGFYPVEQYNLHLINKELN